MKTKEKFFIIGLILMLLNLNNYVLFAETNEIIFNEETEITLTQNSYKGKSGLSKVSGNFNENTRFIADGNLTVNLKRNISLREIEVSNGVLTINGNNHVLILKNSENALANPKGVIILNNIILNTDSKNNGILGDVKIQNCDVTIQNAFTGILGDVFLDKESKLNVSGKYIGINGFVKNSGGEINANGKQIGIFGGIKVSNYGKINAVATGKAIGAESDFVTTSLKSANLNPFPAGFENRLELYNQVGTGVYGIFSISDNEITINGNVYCEGDTAGFLGISKNATNLTLEANSKLEGVGLGNGDYVFGVYIGDTFNNVILEKSSHLKGTANGTLENSIGVYCSNDLIIRNGSSVNARAKKALVSLNKLNIVNGGKINAIGIGENSIGIIAKNISANNILNGASPIEVNSFGKKYGILSENIIAMSNKIKCEIISEGDYGLYLRNFGNDTDNNKLVFDGANTLVKAIGKNHKDCSPIFIEDKDLFSVSDGATVIEQVKGEVLLLDNRQEPDYNFKTINNLQNYTWQVLDADSNYVNGLLETSDGKLISKKNFAGILTASRESLETPIFENIILNSDNNIKSKHVLITPTILVSDAKQPIGTKGATIDTVEVFARDSQTLNSAKKIGKENVSVLDMTILLVVIPLLMFMTYSVFAYSFGKIKWEQKR